MDYTPRVTSTPSIRVHDHNGNNHGRKLSTSRSAGVSIPRSPAPIGIPNARTELPPPPLPPPRNIGNIVAGSDPGWAWGNDPGGGFGKSGGSSMTGSNFPKSWGSRPEEKRHVERQERPEYRRRESSSTTIKSPTDTDRRYDFARQQDEGYYSVSGPRPSAMTQQLHGERHLQQWNLESSSQTYDNKLLSKLGKPKTPPRNYSLGSVDSSPTSSIAPYSSGHPPQLRSLSFPNSANSAYSNSAYSETPPIKREPTGFGDSPISRPMSPGFPYSAASAKSPMDWRSPKHERSVLSPVGSEPDPYYPQRFPSSTNVSRQQKSRRSKSGSILSSYDESAAKNTANERIIVKRESYDQNIFSEPDSADPSFPMRHLHLEDRAPISQYPDSDNYYQPRPSPSLHTSRSRPGMKRRASQSPPPAQSHGANAQLLAAAGITATADLYNQRNAPQPRLSPSGRFGQNQGSFSSQSSTGPRNNSYASSVELSVGGSSVTSLGQHSPGGLSPSSEQQHLSQQHYSQQHNRQDSPYVTSLPMNSNPRNTRSQPQYPQPPQPSLENYPDPSIDQKSQMDPNQRRPGVPNMQSHAFICQCCPKKPKKFDTAEELGNHESEKQYSCQYCNNRFKNKNEAERHQNSLHLRKHSWSCSVLGNHFPTAFYASTSFTPGDNTPGQAPPPPDSNSDFDTCGYCGEQFANNPAPDWDVRGQHLTNVHKFGECNQSKKFFRADHFRQHLKHSHAGTSGKWTNMLETACMKDEPSPQPMDNSNGMQTQGAPIANMGMGPGGMGQAPMGQANMGQGMGQAQMSQNMAQSLAQAGMHQANMGRHMGQDMGPDMGQDMGQNMGQSHMGQIDMSNIDPSIGLQTMGNMGPMANMGNMAGPPGRGMSMRGGQMQEFKEEMP